MARAFFDPVDRSLNNALGSVIDLPQHVASRYTDNVAAQTRQVGRPSCVASDLAVFGMMRAVNFDHQLRGRAVEVGDIRSDRELAPKCWAFPAQQSQTRPEQHFWRAHRLAERLSASVSVLG
jgi:hypothetical protein